ncbi:hypothetical protein [Oryzomonas rubra]|uniref:Uncharacterized protein n=1 Tax=Oryzomonas rubra TaxID=2509454 RepID=A0A5A9X972_9BACT|nr:hypothetical protein [Oryzomonas rubra]KAA0888749.1 hypothetical protein ET418_15325 [Oryzomonas rubra]
MKLPLSFTRGDATGSVLLKSPMVLDADGKRVVAIAWSPALTGCPVEGLDQVAAGFAAYPELLDALHAVLAPFRLLAERLPDEQKPDAQARIDKALAAIAKAGGGRP